jgi:O-acetyl-ADP-ribose deacetylase (regulator of RNase III)
MILNIAKRKGDILSVKEGIVIHGCNAQGVMGSGLALQVKRQYHKSYETYYIEHLRGNLHLGEVVWYQHAGTNLYIANAITQQYYGRDPNVRYVDYDAISAVFKDVTKKALELCLPVHFPRIGAGYANGDWATIQALITAEMHPSVNYVYWEPGYSQTVE